MFWWITLAVVVTFGAAILLKVTRASTLLAGLIAIPLTRLLFLFNDDEASRELEGTLGSLLAAFLSCLAGSCWAASYSVITRLALSTGCSARLSPASRSWSNWCWLHILFQRNAREACSWRRGPTWQVPSGRS